jgi:hypothetical protein
VSLIARERTPATEIELAQALSSGHDLFFDALPSPEKLGVAWAQCALELARGKAIWNNNIGNITAGRSWPGDFYELHVPPPDPPVLKFRAHASLVDGAVDYWKVLTEHFGSAMPFFVAGKAEAASRELGRLHYYLADPNVYAPATARLYDEFFRRGIATDVHSPMLYTPPSPEELASTGRLWRLIDQLDAGGDTGMDVIDRLGREPTS